MAYDLVGYSMSNPVYFAKEYFVENSVCFFAKKSFLFYVQNTQKISDLIDYFDELFLFEMSNLIR